MVEFGSSEHIESLSHEQLKDLCRYVFQSRSMLEEVIRQKNSELAELREKVQNQGRQLMEMQAALERRNNGELKRRWQKQVDGLQAENAKMRELLHALQATDGWPDDDKLISYGIDPESIHDCATYGFGENANK